MKPSLGFYSPLVLGRRLPRQPHPPHHTASGFVCVELAVKTIVGSSTGWEIEDCDWIHGVDKDVKEDEFPWGLKDSIEGLQEIGDGL
ncbi:hypothetical protein C1H46_029125 [Malus baccata]|uniref:Uncharacterized protein n=1 Tax=Malus baccata TaxID=106549 RepID=A0A540LFT4_MALBA|nr:hypothetical protein C1H46_029125 [Malus baccata]